MRYHLAPFLAIIKKPEGGSHTFFVQMKRRTHFLLVWSINLIDLNIIRVFDLQKSHNLILLVLSMFSICWYLEKKTFFFLRDTVKCLLEAAVIVPMEIVWIRGFLHFLLVHYLTVLGNPEKYHLYWLVKYQHIQKSIFNPIKVSALFILF